jgi:hypothetical protein
VTKAFGNTDDNTNLSVSRKEPVTMMHNKTKKAVEANKTTSNKQKSVIKANGKERLGVHIGREEGCWSNSSTYIGNGLRVRSIM